MQTPRLPELKSISKALNEKSVKTLTADKAKSLPAEGWSIQLSGSDAWKVFKTDSLQVPKAETIVEEPKPVAKAETIVEEPKPVEKAPEVQTFKAGGTPIAIPAPTSDMVETGYDNREMMEVFVPAQNRLIAAFVLATDLPALTRGDENLKMAKYAMVQVPRGGEYTDCGVSEFKEVTDSLAVEFESLIDSVFEEVEDELGRRMKSLEIDLNIGKPTQLGTLFTKQNAYCFGMIIPVILDGETTHMAMGATLLRVKKRLLFIYLYADYKDEETVKWLSSNSEKWADAILAANK